MLGSLWGWGKIKLYLRVNSLPGDNPKPPFGPILDPTDLLALPFDSSPLPARPQMLQPFAGTLVRIVPHAFFLLDGSHLPCSVCCVAHTLRGQSWIRYKKMPPVGFSESGVYLAIATGRPLGFRCGFTYRDS